MDLSTWIERFIERSADILDVEQLATNLEEELRQADVHYGQAMPSRFLIFGRANRELQCFELSNEQDIVNREPVGRRLMRLERLVNEEGMNPWVTAGGFIAARRLLERLFLEGSDDIEDILPQMPHQNTDFRLSEDLIERIEAARQIAVTELDSASAWLRSSLECVRDIWIAAGEQGIGGDIQIMAIE